MLVTKIIHLLRRDAVWKETSTRSFEFLCMILGHWKLAKSWDAKECNTSWRPGGMVFQDAWGAWWRLDWRTCQWAGDQGLCTASIRTESDRRGHFWTLLKREIQFSSLAGLHYFLLSLLMMVLILKCFSFNHWKSSLKQLLKSQEIILRALSKCRNIYSKKSKLKSHLNLIPHLIYPLNPLMTTSSPHELPQ